MKARRIRIPIWYVIPIIIALVVGLWFGGVFGDRTPASAPAQSPGGQQAAVPQPSPSPSILSLTTTPSPTPTPTPTPSPSPSPNLSASATPLTGDVDLTNKVVPKDIPGLLIGSGVTITSIGDGSTRPREVYAIALQSGQTLQVDLDVPNNSFNENGYVNLGLEKPGTTSASSGGGFGAGYCATGGHQRCTQLIATPGTYYLVANVSGSGVRYTLSVNTQ
ncbi:hypothetical protein [Nitrolancea hollandica]|uniref:Uncharacterized protein n=1 Tax=Nitrolancea hollandica Lb TaxID=1129897 RepID=I4EIX4_9BACT|nr:hypothetical protein [Nitrolancea hollandica]CCF84636.1 exported hypothetical protein [Nitrolancea hollandica Lb]